jgi:hypothetical protein
MKYARKLAVHTATQLIVPSASSLYFLSTQLVARRELSYVRPVGTRVLLQASQAWGKLEVWECSASWRSTVTENGVLSRLVILIVLNKFYHSADPPDGWKA